MILHDLSPGAVGKMARVDLAALVAQPEKSAYAFDFHGCGCDVAAFVGEPPWELHGGGDELIHVLAGSVRLTLRQNGEETVRMLGPGDLAIIPQGCWHRNNAADGVTALVMTPIEGNRHSWDDPGN